MHQPQEELREQLAAALFRIGRQMNAGFSGALGDVARTEYMTLHQIDHFAKASADGRVSVSQLVARAWAPASGVSRTLKSLEKRGCIERSADKADRRKTFVWLTPAGKQLLADCQRRFGDWGDEIIARFGEEKCRQLTALCKELNDAIAAVNTADGLDAETAAPRIIITKRAAPLPGEDL